MQFAEQVFRSDDPHVVKVFIDRLLCNLVIVSFSKLNPFSPVILICFIFTGGIARSATRRYLIYSEADFEVFLPAGATSCTDWGEIWHWGGDPPHAKFHPSWCNGYGIGSPKLKFLLRFDQNVESIARFSQNLQSLYPVSVGWICSRGNGFMGVLN